MINGTIIAGFVAGVIATVLVFFVFGLGFAVIRPRVQLKLSGGRGSLLQIMAMRLRGAPTRMTIEAHTTLLHSGEKVRLTEVEATYLANRGQIIEARDLVEHVRERSQRDGVTRENTQ